MKCNCGGKYVYDEGVIYCEECFHVIYREHDEKIGDLKKFFRFFIGTGFMTLYAITSLLGLSYYVVQRVHEKVKAEMSK